MCTDCVSEGVSLTSGTNYKNLEASSRSRYETLKVTRETLVCSKKTGGEDRLTEMVIIQWVNVPHHFFFLLQPGWVMFAS